jgi:hypothetical protein
MCRGGKERPPVRSSAHRADRVSGLRLRESHPAEKPDTPRAADHAEVLLVGRTDLMKIAGPVTKRHDRVREPHGYTRPLGATEYRDELPSAIGLELGSCGFPEPVAREPITRLACGGRVVPESDVTARATVPGAGVQRTEAIADRHLGLYRGEPPADDLEGGPARRDLKPQAAEAVQLAGKTQDRPAAERMGEGDALGRVSVVTASGGGEQDHADHNGDAARRDHHVPARACHFFFWPA